MGKRTTALAGALGSASLMISSIAGGAYSGTVTRSVCGSAFFIAEGGFVQTSSMEPDAPCAAELLIGAGATEAVYWPTTDQKSNVPTMFSSRVRLRNSVGTPVCAVASVHDQFGVWLQDGATSCSSGTATQNVVLGSAPLTQFGVASLYFPMPVGTKIIYANFSWTMGAT